MGKERHDLRVLMLQIRKEEQVRQEELSSFARYSKLSIEQFDVLNVFDTEHFHPDVVEKYDGVFVGGASGTSVLEPERFSFLQDCFNLLLHCIDINKPVFASCYGFQMAVIALGGEIIRDEELFEMGTPLISLSDASKDDPLFCDVPNPFPAVSVHHEKALELPRNCELLASTDICVHAFRVGSKPFWACQFHPEVDKDIITERLAVYKHIYTNGDEHFREVIDSVVDTPESNALLEKFVTRILLSVP